MYILRCMMSLNESGVIQQTALKVVMQSAAGDLQLLGLLTPLPTNSSTANKQQHRLSNFIGDLIIYQILLGPKTKVWKQ